MPTQTDPNAQIDPHSHLQPGMPRTTFLDWRADVDFSARRLHATATLTFDAAGPADVVLDTRSLEVHSVTTDQGQAIPYSLGPTDEILGEPLSFALPAGVGRVTIGYDTTEGSTALQWLGPEQTADGVAPFLFSQCQTIHARSMIPLHDSMSAKLGFTAKVRAPKGMTALMSAATTATDERPDGSVEYSFSAPDPRPPYLIVLVVGALASREVGPRSTLWAEPGTIEAAAYEFGEVDTLLTSAEKLYGPYPWGRFDFIIMPPSYPYGGLENPRLTYVAATVIIGDRSEVGVLNHEIAHHWSGDLVTGASMNHFWINEGLTTYAERRITEATAGRDVSDLQTALAIDELHKDFAFFSDEPELTQLRKDLTGLDPDTTSSWVSHEKGGLFIRALEEAVGREQFDPFFKQFFVDFAYQSITTEEFIDYVQRVFPDAIDYHEWLYGYWLPQSMPPVTSRILDEVRALDQAAPGPQAASWSSEYWKAYLSTLEAPKDPAFLEGIDGEHNLIARSNLEIRVPWLELGIRSGYRPAIAPVVDVLGTVGRMKYLKPLYDALLETPDTRDTAVVLYRRNRHFYHPIARNVVESRFKKEGIDRHTLEVPDE